MMTLGRTRRQHDIVSAGGSAKALIKKRREEGKGLNGEGGGTSMGGG